MLDGIIMAAIVLMMLPFGGFLAVMVWRVKEEFETWR